MEKIVQTQDPVLRKIAKEVGPTEIQSKEIKEIIKKMKSALLSQHDGVALAAPQIGVSKRIFIVSGKVIDLLKGVDVEHGEYKKREDEIYINPKITKLSKDKAMMEEGCLSARYLYGKIERSKKANIEALDENSKLFKKGASGLMAQIFQHETDHLDGKLFIDRAVDVVDLPPKEDDN